MLDKLTNVLEGIEGNLKTIVSVFDYILHPGKILVLFWNFTVEASYIICLFGAIGCIILYALGYKKYGKGATLSVVIYTVIQAINAYI